jgi:two-component system OmpR family sensor kinase
MTPPLPSIRYRLSVWLLGISLTFAALTAVAVWLVMNHEMDEMMDQELRESGELIYHLFVNAPDQILQPAPDQGELEYEEHLIWQLVDLQTEAVLAKSHKAPNTPLLGKPVADVVPVFDGFWHATTFMLKKPAPRLLVVAQSDDERDEAKREGVLYALLSAVFSALVVSLLLDWRIQKELHPLQKLSRQVRDYDPVSPASRLDAASRLELKPIEASVRELGNRLAQRSASEKAFIAHAAHALRTPVAGIDAQLAIAEREADDKTRPRIARARGASQRLRYVMQALLSLFRSGMELGTREIDLDDFVRGLEFPGLEPEIIQGGRVVIDPDLFAAVLFNLLDNSRAHNATRSTMHLGVENGWYRLSLQDNGDGCSAQRLHRLRQALQAQDYRPESGLNGLGLVLADVVMRSHHGRVDLPEVPSGFCVHLCWPVPELQQRVLP